MFAHGVQKLVGGFGDAGCTEALSYFTETIGIPVVLIIVLAESMGSVARVIGFKTRIAAASIASVMPGAITEIHWRNRFFMNWNGD